MQRTVALLALSMWIAVAIVSCGDASDDNNVNSQTPTPAATRTSTPTPSPASSVSSASGPCTATKKPIVTKPPNGGSVALNDVVAGTTPCSEMRHYVVVTPLENSVNWVQDSPATTDANGSFTGQAQFGQGENGIGKKFLIRVLVTKATLRPGQLPEWPTDAILSEPVTVTRNQ